MADNLFSCPKNTCASSIPLLDATLSSISRLLLDVENPLADAHLTDGAENFSPAISLDS